MVPVYYHVFRSLPIEPQHPYHIKLIFYYSSGPIKWIIKQFEGVDYWPRRDSMLGSKWVALRFPTLMRQSKGFNRIVSKKSTDKKDHSHWTFFPPFDWTFA
jgi:hypothetical protein